MNSMPKVVINAGIRSFVTKTPFTKPKKEAMSTVNSTPRTPPTTGTKVAPRTATKASIDPIEISKSPLAIQKFIPTAAIPIKEENLTLLIRLKPERKAGERDEKTTTKITRIKGRP